MTKTQILKPGLQTKLKVSPLAIALGSGLLLGSSPAPLNLWLLAWVTIAPLWVLVVQQSQPSAQPTTHQRRGLAFFRLPLLWGIGYHGLALSWITGLHPLTWMGIPWLGSIAITLLAWGFITLWGATLVCSWAGGMGLLHRWWQKRRHPIDSVMSPPAWLRILWGTALWCGLETLWSLGALNWTSVSYTQSPTNLAILHLGQISGSMTVTAAIVAVNGCWAEAWLLRSATTTRKATHQPEASTDRQLLMLGGRWSGAKFYAALAIALLISLHSIGWHLASQPLVERPAAALKVGIIQGNVPTRIKLFAAGLRQAMTGYTMGYEQLVEQNVDVVLTPEGALPLIWQGANRDRSALDQAVRARQVPLWLGTLMPQGDRLTQSLITLQGDGEIWGRYNKIKLVPLGEYIPFSSHLGGMLDRLAIGRSNLLAGSDQQQFDTPFGQAAVAICYEIVFPELLRSQVAAGAEFMLTVANLDPYSTVLMAQYHAHDVMRAIETDRWVARATNTGYSGIIDPHGTTHWLSQPHTYATHAATIYRRSTQTLYSRWGNWLTLCLGGAAVVAIGIKGRH
jgi:apolipoprotein N-acyltransferase